MPTHNFGQKINQNPFQALVLRILPFFEIQIQYFHVNIKNPFPITKLRKYVEIICTPRDGKVKNAKVFQVTLKGQGKSPILVGGREILVRGQGFFHQVVKICCGVILSIQTFFKAKSNILLILNIDKTKISVTCVYKQYAIKM